VLSGSGNLAILTHLATRLWQSGSGSSAPAIRLCQLKSDNPALASTFGFLALTSRLWKLSFGSLALAKWLWQPGE